MNSVELMVNILKGKHISKDDFLKNQITTHPETYEVSQNLFSICLCLGKMTIPFSLEGTHKGKKIGKCSEEPSLGVSVTCCFMIVSCQSPHLDRTEATK